MRADAIFEHFLDTAYAYRFGEPSHDVTVATLTDASGAMISEAFHFPLGRYVDPPRLFNFFTQFFICLFLVIGVIVIFAPK